MWKSLTLGRNTTVSVSHVLESNRRGDYVHMSGFSRLENNRSYRITHFGDDGDRTRWSVRPVHKLRLAEWFHRRYEDWILWPLRDLRSMIVDAMEKA